MVRHVGTLLCARDAENISDSAVSAARLHTPSMPGRRRAERQSTGKVGREPALPHRVTTEQRCTDPLLSVRAVANRQGHGRLGPITRGVFYARAR